MTSKVWFVTGSSSGLGLSVVKYALFKGDKVVATLRKPEVLSALENEYDTSQLLIVKLDVTNADEITTAFAIAQETFGRIDVVYNNAGFTLLAEVELSPDKVNREMFEVNFWGAANVSREAVRFLRDVNSPPGGRLIQASSVSGVIGSIACGYYSATKFALVGLSEALHQEIDPSWNIKITILDLGPFNTKALDTNVVTVVPPHPNYVNTTSAMRAFVAGDKSGIGNSDKAAREIHRIANDDLAPLHVALGVEAISATKAKIGMLNDGLEKSTTYSIDLK